MGLFAGGSRAFSGLTAIKPGEVRVVQLFGGYRGTVRTTGLRWVNLFAERRKVSVRIRNKETPTVKVNDSDGNPIEIAAVVVWQVRDSARGDLRRRRLCGVRQYPERGSAPPYCQRPPL